MTNNKVIELHKDLQGIKNLKGAKVNYAIARTLAALEPIILSFRKTLDPSEAYQKYDTLRAELAKKHAAKDEKGKPVIEDNAYKLENLEEFDKELDVLITEHKEAVDERKTQVDNFNKFLTEESDFQPFTFLFTDLPEDITTDQMNTLLPLIAE